VTNEATQTELVAASRSLARSVGRLRFGPPVTHVYNPLTYARRPHEDYLARYGSSPKSVVFVGMNPGPFGMAQTGVPFGVVELVRQWLGIEQPVSRPRTEHPKRPIEGFQCRRDEVSGRRLWGAVRDQFGTPRRFFSNHFVANYCPLLFMEESGRNRTPDKLPKAEREALFRVCDRHLQRLVRALAPSWVVGIGAFADGRAREALDGYELRFARIPHPSPANPAAQKDWAGKARRALKEQGVCR
jgi:single-strand selective monofunctional uracil DNA glycosylase